MIGSRRVLVATLVLSVLATGASAQLTVGTDRAAYVQGDAVRVTVHNGGPSPATFYSDPAYVIRNASNGECPYGCYGLPVVWSLPVGGTIVGDHATGGFTPGQYVVQLTGSSPDSGSILECRFSLTAPVPSEGATWTLLKTLYR
jgi:hypothetical protein